MCGRIQRVVLEDFLKSIQGPGKGRQGKTGQTGVFVGVEIKGGQQIPRLHQRIIRTLAPGAEQAALDVRLIQKIFELPERTQIDGPRKTVPGLPWEFAAAKRLCPVQGHAVRLLVA